MKKAMTRFGSDKPDLRIPLELVTICDIIKDVDFKVFAAPAGMIRNAKLLRYGYLPAVICPAKKLMITPNLSVFMAPKV